jgi:tetratricopeptide (TPR) repeat protein
VSQVPDDTVAHVQAQAGAGNAMPVTPSASPGEQGGTFRERKHWVICWFSNHPRILIASVLIVCLVPFVNKAVQTDDVLFVFAGQWIQKHSINFFGSQVNWWMSSTPMWVANYNPPLLSYFLAAVASVFGWSEITLHLACTAVAIVAALGIYTLAQRWCQRPLLATWVAVFTPAFFVSSTTLMCDVMMLGFWVWAVVFWDRGLTSNRAGWGQFAFAGALAGLAFLTKYSVVTLLPLLPLLSLLRKRKAVPSVVGLLIPLLIIAGYELVTARLYGRGLFSGAVHYSSTNQLPLSWEWKGLIDLTFTGGSLLTLLFFAPVLWRRYGWLAGAILAPGIVFLTFRALNHAGFYRATTVMHNWRFLPQAIILSTGALHLLCLVVVEGWRRKDLITRILLLWIGAVFLFATVLNWTVNVRAFLPMVPAAAILMVRRLDATRAQPAKESRLLWPLAPAALLAFGIALADYESAGQARTAARYFAAKYKSPDQTLWFEGHGTFQYYMEATGARPVDVERTAFKPGDIVVVPELGIISALPREAIGWVEGLELPSSVWIRVTGGGDDGPAGFYSALNGLLPFAFGKLTQNYSVVKSFLAVRFDSSPGNPEEVRAGGAPSFPSSSWKIDKRPIYSLKPEVWQRIRDARQLARQGDLKAAFQLYDQLLKQDPDNPLALIDVAWILATNEKPQMRNGLAAVKMAQRAVQLTDQRQLQFMVTLAAAYAEAGQFAEAVKTTRIIQAIARLTGQHQIAAHSQLMIRFYGAGKPMSVIRPFLGDVPIVPNIPPS